jgi:hypothetical protein
MAGTTIPLSMSSGFLIPTAVNQYQSEYAIECIA